jgi:hypothetical protein
MLSSAAGVYGEYNGIGVGRSDPEGETTPVAAPMAFERQPSASGSAAETSVRQRLTACDRLVRIFERALALEPGGVSGSDDTVRVPRLNFALSLLRMRIGPALAPGWLVADPVHVVLCGGTNTGKSTVLNVLLGREAAGMGVRARFSQHAEGYRASALGDAWLVDTPTRFAGYARYCDEHPPRQSDAALRRDGYQPAFALLDPTRLPGPALAPPATTSAVLWDGPDYSTEEAGAYLQTVLDLLGLADLVLMMVTDESYADARGNAFLGMVSETKVEVLNVANKLPENPALINDVARTLDTAGSSQAPLFRLPEVRGASTAERMVRLLATPEASSLRDAVARESARRIKLKRQALEGSFAFLESHFEELLRPLASEVGAAADWKAFVDRTTRALILEPHRRDYLEGVSYGEFNRTLVHVMELLKVPWIGTVLELAGKVVKTPFRLASAAARRLAGMASADSQRPAEEEILRQGIASWMAALRAEAQLRAAAGGHAAWADITRELDAPKVRDAFLERFTSAFAAYRTEIDAMVRTRAEALYGKLKENPKRLNALRSANLVSSAASIVLVVKTAGLNWSDVVIGPLVAGLWQNLLEWGLGRYLETLRGDLVQEQARALESVVRTSLEEPGRALFRGAVSADDLDAAREDFGLVRDAALKIAGGGDG